MCLVYAGEGFSPGILHMLAATPIAAYCLPSDVTLMIPPEAVARSAART
ncbi:MAG: hypothetical protein IT371_06690 [Deltaproteobacteria bacterium]|nr:hypothetical protein [Deltaproteobacteria bacterium]